jgi:hypothetical protein
MHDRGDEQRRSLSLSGEDIREAHKAVGHLPPGCCRAEMERIDHVVAATGSAQVICRLEPVGGEGVEMGEYLERGATPGIDLRRNGRCHRDGGRHGSVQRRLVEGAAKDLQGYLGSLEGGRVTCSRKCRGMNHIRGTGPHGPIPEQSIDFGPGCVQGISDTGQTGETGEWIAQ